MKKIISLFKRDYDGTGLVYDEVTPGAEWVTAGEGVATEKFDGTCCMVRDGVLYKRYDRKLNRKTGKHKAAPDNWEACEPEPNEHTGHWPGWVLVSGTAPGDRWHREGHAWILECGPYVDGTHELVGPKVQGNPHKLNEHQLWLHGCTAYGGLPRTFTELRAWFDESGPIEGLVWHHPDGRMVKIKRRDFGLVWPA